MRIAVVVSHSYAMQVSPTVKDICRYLAVQGFDVDIYIDQFYPPDLQFSIPGAEIIKAESNILWHLLRFIDRMPINMPNRNSFFMRVLHKLFGKEFATGQLRSSLEKFKPIISLWQLKKKLKKYDWIFCIEIMALDIVEKSGWDLSHASYLSLESVQLVSKYELEYIRDLFRQISFCIIQSPERGKDFEEYLGLKLDFEYLPVSMLPRIPRNRTVPTPPTSTRILYSGYIAEWAQLLEFLVAYSACDAKARGMLVLQGHYFGTQKYLEQLQSIASKMEGVVIQTNYLADQEFYDFIDGFDVGLALYKAPDDNPVARVNWDNLIFSSGKIAAYLWSGLAVITNIDSLLSRKPPFLYIDVITAENIAYALKEYESRRSEYRDAALKCANQCYNMERSMIRIIERIKS